jgi:cytosine/adenosine deaminase-related metal-dependent hydrolase
MLGVCVQLHVAHVTGDAMAPGLVNTHSHSLMPLTGYLLCPLLLYCGFSREVYTDFVTWLQFERPEELPVLIHPYTDEMVSAGTCKGCIAASCMNQYACRHCHRQQQACLLGDCCCTG